MFNFEFSNKKTISRDSSSYPITIETVKAKSFYFQENPDDESQDTYIEEVLIPAIVRNWERNTGYVILDTSIQAFVPNIQNINSFKLEIPFSNLNIRSITSIKYYPCNWDESESKTTMDSEDYKISEEIIKKPSSFRLSKNLGNISIYPITNNLEANYLAGFLDNDFSDLDPEITDALNMQAAVAIDTKMGYCDDYYSSLIYEAYNKFSKEKPLVTFI
jgi:hypothetical protein